MRKFANCPLESQITPGFALAGFSFRIKIYRSPMKQTYINQLKDHIGEEVTLKGWLYNSRSSGKLVFLQLRDGTGIVQCVVFKGNNEEVFERATALGQESSLVVHGAVKEDTRSPIGVEVDVKEIEVLQNVHDYPITPKE